MTTPSAMQPTSSASSADKLAELIRQIDGNHDMGAGALAEALLPHLSGIVPQVVQAPTNEAVETAANVFKSIFFNAGHDGETANDQLDRAMRAAIISSGYVAAPIVATVPSEPILYQRRMRPAWRDAVTGWSGWEDCSKESAEEILRLPTFSEDWQYETRTLYAAPSTAEQASDVRNAALEEAALICDKSSLQPAIADRIRALKSATPADKGNAPAEAKSSQGDKQ